jgi:hypothetical protein
MDRFVSPRWTAAAVAGAVVLVTFVGLAFLGGQTSTILSTVGSSVGPNPDVAAQPQGAGQPDRPEPTPASGTGSTAGGQVADADALAPAPGLLIVRTGTLRLEVGAVPEALERAAAIVAAAGGYVAASKETGSGVDSGGSIDLRIPATAWDRTLGSLRELGTVRGQDIGTEEVTGQVVDLDARVANLRATEAALQAIMAKATKIDDVLDVQRQLTDTRGEIERLVAKAASLRDRAAFGSLSVALVLPAIPKPTVAPSVAPGWDPARDVDLATGKLVQVGQAATTGGIWVAIVGVPILLAGVLGAILLRILWLLARRAGLAGARDAIG